jgi:hypothetical protein
MLDDYEPLVCHTEYQDPALGQLIPFQRSQMRLQTIISNVSDLSVRMSDCS